MGETRRLDLKKGSKKWDVKVGNLIVTSLFGQLGVGIPGTVWPLCFYRMPDRLGVEEK